MRAPALIALIALLDAACGPDAPQPDAADQEVTEETADAIDSDDTDTADADPWRCQIDGETPPYLELIGCEADFFALASEPLDASIPAARSLKTVYDRISQTLYFQDVHRHPTHYTFCATYLSGNGLPPVPDLGTFNQREYYAPTRRFLLGSLTHYAGPDLFAYELAPYDTASAEMVETAITAIASHSYLGERVVFHPTSLAHERLALPAHIARVTTDELFAGIAYQPLNLATSTGRLRFVRAADLSTTHLDFRDIVVLDFVPNDIAVVQGIITDQLQTPLAHINVLSQNRGTPNMALRGAFTDPALRALEGRWVELQVGAFAWSIREVSQADADAWWEAHRPEPLGIPERDLSVSALTPTETLLQGDDLAAALAAAIPAFGGKASNYAALTRIPELTVEPAFAIPMHWYARHLSAAALDGQIAAMLDDPLFLADPAERRARLSALRDAIIAAPLDPDLLADVLDHLDALPRRRARFRSSTNAEDLDGFTGAGLYTSQTGDPDDPDDPVDLAIKTVWASVWGDKAFAEREYRGIDHQAVGMALLVSPSFPNEEANGVAISANLFDPSGLEPAFVINVQRGTTSVVLPPPGVESDYFIYYFYYPGQPATYLAHSNLVAPGATVLTATQTFALGQALDALHTFFAPVYRHPDRFYGMDVEFKFDAPPGAEPRLFIKQARPHPGWGL